MQLVEAIRPDMQALAVEDYDPRKLPVVIPQRSIARKALIGLSHAWVLHRRRVVMTAVAVIATAGLGVVWQARDALASAGASVVRMVQGEFAAAGFGIDRMQISGQVLSSDHDIVTLMNFAAGSSTLNFDAQKAMARLHWLRAVESATVRRVYPDQIIVEIVEKVPVARWRVGSVTWLVDKEGTRVGEAVGTSYAELPLVVGEGAADDALVMVKALERHENLTRDLAAVSRIGDRRWDLIYYSGLRVRLPELGVAQALSQLDMYQRDFALLDRDITLIDLRVPGQVSYKPAVREDAEADKKKKKK